MEFSELPNRVIGCAIEVHRKLGPGLLESTYEQCLAHELSLNGINFNIQLQRSAVEAGSEEFRSLILHGLKLLKLSSLITLKCLRLLDARVKLSSTAVAAIMASPDRSPED